MPLTAGVQFGHYEIVARLGAGGMGEVYRARDPRLGREVALKILPAEFAKDPGRRARFAQEARAAAALNHPNIVALHDIGEDHDIAYIVTELVPGETLRALVERGAVPVRKLLDIAVQIAAGMTAAHAAHITHRDLKPANIMVSPDGRVKILDFGLARQSNTAVSESADTVSLQTQPGMIVGTASYMSPEQARGQMVDFRSDQFSFGLILYEMVTGKRAFERPESVQTISAILTDEPAPIERTIPGPLRWVIERCLSKDPSDRYESTRDLFHELRELRDHLSDASTAQAAVASVPRRMRSWYIAAASVLSLVFGLLAGGLYLAPPSSPDQAAYRFTPFVIDLSSKARGVWSADGKAVAYQERVRGKEQVFVRYLDSPLPVRLTNMSEPAYPFAWTPDGQRILFYTDQKLPGVWSVAAAGGEPESMLSEDSKNFLYVAATHTASPDLGALAVVAAGPDGWWSVWISAPPGSPLKKYSPDPFATRRYLNYPTLRFSPDGKYLLLFPQRERGPEESWLLPYPPDPSRPPRPLPGRLPVQGGTPMFSWMPDSRRIVVSTKASSEGTYQLWMADTFSGDHYALTSGTTNRQDPAVSRMEQGSIQGNGLRLRHRLCEPGIPPRLTG